MARPLRIEYPGAAYHITSRGNEKKAVYDNDQDRANFLSILQHVNKRYNWIQGEAMGSALDIGQGCLILTSRSSGESAELIVLPRSARENRVKDGD